MKAFVFLAVLLFAGSPLLAQPPSNAIFFGGNADGWGGAQNTPPGAVSQGGGIGSGGSGGTSGAGTASNQFGGTADGHSVAAYEQLTASPLLNNGGAGDGHSTSSNTPVAAVTNAGGVGDGWDFLAKEAPPAVTNGGGPGDGHSINGQEPVGLVVNQFGGAGDGWASNVFIGPLTPPTPLPQEFLSFSAKKDGKRAMLDWKMGSEQGVDRYIVERSSNAVSFAAIGEVAQQEPARGAYSFPDEKPLRGHNYYRIRIVSGSVEKLTPVRLVVFDEAVSGLAMTLYPNPATTRITAALPAAWIGSNTVLNIYGAAGTLVVHQRFKPLATTSVQLDLEGLAPGVYTLQAATDNESLRAPFVKR